MLTKDLDRVWRNDGQIVFPWPQSFRSRLLLRVQVVLPKKSHHWWTVGFISLGNTHRVVTAEELEMCAAEA